MNNVSTFYLIQTPRLLDFEKNVPPTFTQDPRVRAKEKNYWKSKKEKERKKIRPDNDCLSSQYIQWTNDSFVKHDMDSYPTTSHSSTYYHLWI